jgi:chemotaxis protein MotB
MSAESNEWISIGDLMAGVVGVVMLMFVSAAVVSTAQANRDRKRVMTAHKAAEQTAYQEHQQARRAAEQRLASTESALEAFRNEAADAGVQEMVHIDTAARLIQFREATFKRGSACVQPLAGRLLTSLSERMRDLLVDRADRTIRIEGHTDSVPVILRPGGPRTCALFDDNFTLSAARAREARNALTDGWPEPLRRRVTVAGLGDTRPLVADPASPENRRVEISIQDGDAARSEPEPRRAVPTPR